MIRLLALLCLAASAFAIGGFMAKWEKAVKVRFSISLRDITTGNAFMPLPQTVEEAVKENYVNMTRPEGHEKFSSLDLYCLECDVAVCPLYDDTGYIAGVQISINPDQVTDVVYDWEVQGFTRWITENKEFYWTLQIFFSSPEYLERSAADRIATRDSGKLLQDDFIYVTGINGTLHAISTDVLEIANTDKSNFTLQGCMPGMGHHYYYKMTKDLECNDELFKFFPLVFKGRLVGLGVIPLFGKYFPKKGCKYYFENPDKGAVQTIVPRGPDCLYQLAESPGLVTMHLYFYNDPSDITCIFE